MAKGAGISDTTPPRLSHFLSDTSSLIPPVCFFRRRSSFFSYYLVLTPIFISNYIIVGDWEI